ncbi:sodium:proton antiporter, partial [Lactiplantibacillus plantarum]
SAHLLSNDYYSDIILVIIVVTMIAPFVLKNAIHRAGQVTATHSIIKEH